MLKRLLFTGTLAHTSLKLLGPRRPGSVLRMAPSCSVALGKPLDLSGLQAPPVQVRGVDQVTSFGPWSSAGGAVPLCPEARLSAPRKVVFSVIGPEWKSLAHSPSLSTPSRSFWVGSLSRLEANPNVWYGVSHCGGGGAEDVPVAAELGLDGLTAQLCSGLWPGHHPFPGCLCGLCPHAPPSPTVCELLSFRPCLGVALLHSV